MRKSTKVYWMIFLVVGVLALWAIFFHFYPVEELVDDIGIQNTYLAAFILALIGGFSSLTGTSLYAALIALSSGGVNPIALGIIAGLGLFASDSAFYFVAHRIRDVITRITQKWDRLFRKVWRIIYMLPPWLVYLGIYAYSAFGPLPNDVILAVLALSSYSYRQFAIFLFAGDLTMSLLLTHFGDAF